MFIQFRKGVAGALAAALLLVASAAPAPAQRQKGTAKQQAEARKQAEKAAKVFRQIMSVPDKAIPRELLQNAEAVAVFPDVIKAGVLLVGGRGGKGVISRRIPGGWSAPAFFKIGGGSFGPQIGASSTDFVLLFMNDGAMAGLLSVFAEFERDMIRERVKAGIAQARAEGKRHGRPRTAATIAAQVSQLYKQGGTNRALRENYKSVGLQ